MEARLMYVLGASGTEPDHFRDYNQISQNKLKKSSL